MSSEATAVKGFSIKSVGWILPHQKFHPVWGCIAVSPKADANIFRMEGAEIAKSLRLSRMSAEEVEVKGLLATTPPKNILAKEGCKRYNNPADSLACQEKEVTIMIWVSKAHETESML